MGRDTWCVAELFIPGVTLRRLIALLTLLLSFEFVADHSVPGVYRIPNSKQLYRRGDSRIGHPMSNDS